MSDKTIPELNEATQMDNNTLFPMDSGIQTYRIKGSNIKKYMTEGATPPVGFGGFFMDFGGLLSYDTAVWCPIIGQTISDIASPLDGVTLPDTSYRMLLGYGTESGGDNASDTWVASVFGNANHQINLQHAHDYEAAWRDGSGNYGIPRNATLSLPAVSCSIINPQNSPSYRLVTGATLGSSNVTTNSCTTAGTVIKNSTYNNLSSAQSILPRSIKVRWILRYK